MSGYQSGAQCVSNGVGGAVITWQDHRNENWDIYAQRADSSGLLLWDTNGIGVCMADSTQGPYVVETDNRSGAIIAWKDYRADNWDIYCQRVDSSGVLQWGEDGLGVCTTQERQNWGPVLVGDAEGGVIISWGETGNGGRVRAQRVDSSGNLRWGGIRDEPWGGTLPREVKLEQNWPNPFNANTAIGYQLSAVRPFHTTLKVYNILGEEVRTLVDKRQRPGEYQVVWDGKDKGGRDVSSGIYFCQLRVGRFSQTRKMVLLR